MHTYLPRLKGRQTLIRAMQTAVSGMLLVHLPYAERFDSESNKYVGLVIESASSAAVTIDDASVIVDPNVAEDHRTAIGSEAPLEVLNLGRLEVILELGTVTLELELMVKQLIQDPDLKEQCFSMPTVLLVIWVRLLKRLLSN